MLGLSRRFCRFLANVVLATCLGSIIPIAGKYAVFYMISVVIFQIIIFILVYLKTVFKYTRTNVSGFGVIYDWFLNFFINILLGVF
jgi:hypothetical protein